MTAKAVRSSEDIAKITALSLERHATCKVAAMLNMSPMTPEKAWMLGLIYGDGSLDKRGYLITLTSGDRDVVDHVNQIMGGKIGIDSRQTYWNLQICSKRLWKRTYCCTACGLVMDRDASSGVNILMRFLARLAPYTERCGVLQVSQSSVEVREASCPTHVQQ